jgi:uncharacterized protein (TIGR02266 family)
MGDQQKDELLLATLNVKYKCATVEEFIRQTNQDISLLGVFIKTKTPMKEGIRLKLELYLEDGSPVIRGICQVVWRREIALSDDRPEGMGVKFLTLDNASRKIVDRAVKVRGLTPSHFDRLGEAAARESKRPPPKRISTAAATAAVEASPSAKPAPQVVAADAAGIPTSTLIESPPPPPTQAPPYVARKTVKLKQEPPAKMEPEARLTGTTRRTTPPEVFVESFSEITPTLKELIGHATAKIEQESAVSTAEVAAARAPLPGEASEIIGETIADSASLTPSSGIRYIDTIAPNPVNSADGAPESPNRVEANRTGIRALVAPLYFPFVIIGSKIAASGKALATTAANLTTVRARNLVSVFSRVFNTRLGLAVIGAAAVLALIYLYNSYDATRNLALSRTRSANKALPFKPAPGGRSPAALVPPRGSLSTQTSAISGSAGRGEPESKTAAADETPPVQDDTSDKRQTKPESPAVVPPVMATRRTVEAKTRTVTLHNQIRASVTVTFTCNGVSRTVSVPPVGEASTQVPPHSCLISCRGMGRPTCPALIDADTALLEIR